MTNETKWTNVEDATPDETVWCLVYGDGAMACRAWCAKQRQWQDWQHCQYPGLEMGSITHWQPLPNAPEAELVTEANDEIYGRD